MPNNLPNYKQPPGTKLVGVNLAALTRQQWYGLVEVPEGMDVEQVVETMNNEIDGTEYEDDTDYWEKGHCYAEVELDLDPTDRPQFKIDEDGKLLMLTVIAGKPEEETAEQESFEHADLVLEHIGLVNVDMTRLEVERAEKFIATHQRPISELGFVGHQFSIIVTPTTVGELFSIRDRISGAEEGITQTEKF